MSNTQSMDPQFTDSGNLEGLFEIYHKVKISLNLIIFFIFATITLNANAEVKLPNNKKYPPYPEVWGYDLSEYPAVTGLAGIGSIYRMDDGDIWFIILASYKEIPDPMHKPYEEYKDESYILFKFFNGEKITLTRQEAKELEEKIADKEIKTDPFKQIVNFSDGSKLEEKMNYGGKRCSHMDFWLEFLLKTEKDGAEKRYSILASYPGNIVDIRADEAGCELPGLPFLYQKLHFLAYKLIDLGDDTFLAYSLGSNLIIRFDKNLNTKFIPMSPTVIQSNNYINRNFFVLDFDWLKKWGISNTSETMPFYQSLHDNLLEYLSEKYKQ